MHTIESLLHDKYVDLAIAIILGIILGYLLIRPILKGLTRRYFKKQLPFRAELFNTVKKLSPFFGIAIIANIIRIFPFGEKFWTTFKTQIEVLDAALITFLVAEILVFIYNKLSDKKTAIKAISLFHVLIRILVYTAGIFVISSILEYDVKALLTAMGVGGLAIALALQDTLSNVIAGMQILASRQLKSGDYIKVEDHVEGYVIDINWRNTKLKTLLENVIIVPNSKISSSVTTNYFTIQKNMFFHVPVGVHYDSDLELVEKVTIEVAESVLAKYTHIPKSFKPRVRFNEFADSSINFTVWLAANSYENQHVVRHNFIKALQARFNKEGIIIPFPIRTLHLDSGQKLENIAIGSK